MSAEKKMSNGAPFWICWVNAPEAPKESFTTTPGSLLVVGGDFLQRGAQVRSGGHIDLAVCGVSPPDRNPRQSQ